MPSPSRSVSLFLESEFHQNIAEEKNVPSISHIDILTMISPLIILHLENGFRLNIDTAFFAPCLDFHLEFHGSRTKLNDKQNKFFKNINFPFFCRNMPASSSRQTVYHPMKKLTTHNFHFEIPALSQEH